MIPRAIVIIHRKPGVFAERPRAAVQRTPPTRMMMLEEQRETFVPMMSLKNPKTIWPIS